MNEGSSVANALNAVEMAGKVSYPLANAKWERFVQLVVEGKTWGEAYTGAGYRAKNAVAARSMGQYFMRKPPILARVRALRDELAESMICSKKQALAVLSEIAMTPLSQFVTVGEDGATHADYGVETMNSRALKKVKTRSVRDEAGNVVLETQIQEMELEAKVPAIQQMSKMLGWDAPVQVETTMRLCVPCPWMPAQKATMTITAVKDVTEKVEAGTGKVKTLADVENK